MDFLINQYGLVKEVIYKLFVTNFLKKVEHFLDYFGQSCKYPNF